MIISDEQVRRAAEYLRTSDEYTPCLAVPPLVSEELLARISEKMGSLPDVREERVAEARERCLDILPASGDVAAKLIGRLLSDSIR